MTIYCALLFLISSISAYSFGPRRFKVNRHALVLFSSKHTKGIPPLGEPSKYPKPKRGPIASKPTGEKPGPQKPDAWKAFMKSVETVKVDHRFSKETYLNRTGNSQKPERDELKCKHFEYCSGCSVKSAFTDTPVMQEARAFFASQDIPFKIQASNISAWRTHVKLAVQPLSKWGGLKFGLYKRGSHEVVSIPDCIVQHPQLNKAAELLRLACLDAGVKGYEPPSVRYPRSMGHLRHAQLSLERRTMKVQCTLVWNTEPSVINIELSRLIKLLTKSQTSSSSSAVNMFGGPDLWHSISVNYHTKNTNNIFDSDPKRWRLFWGLPYVKEKIGDAIFSLGPQTFRQANLDFFETGIIPIVQKYITPFTDELPVVAELYSGVGILGLNIASRAQAVLCSDSNGYVDEVFDRGVSSLPLELRERVFFENLDVDAAIDAGQCQDAEILIVDPPRKGLSENLMQFLTNNPTSNNEDKEVEEEMEREMEASLTESKLQRVIYVGCGFEAVQRDAKLLMGSGYWKMMAAEGFALFPGSDHLELVVVFDRVMHRKQREE